MLRIPFQASWVAPRVRVGVGRSRRFRQCGIASAERDGQAMTVAEFQFLDDGHVAEDVDRGAAGRR